MDKYGVKVWFSTPENIGWYRQSEGACYQLPPEQTKLLTIDAKNDVSAKLGIENMLLNKGVVRDSFEIVEVRRMP